MSENAIALELQRAKREKTLWSAHLRDLWKLMAQQKHFVKVSQDCVRSLGAQSTCLAQGCLVQWFFSREVLITVKLCASHSSPNKTNQTCCLLQIGAMPPFSKETSRDVKGFGPWGCSPRGLIMAQELCMWHPNALAGWQSLWSQTAPGYHQVQPKIHL